MNPYIIVHSALCTPRHLCVVVGKQLTSIYRYGHMSVCGPKLEEFKFCMSLKGMHPEEKRDVIAYLDALEENGSPGGLSLGSLGPVTEGLYAWTIILALLMGTAVWLGAKAK